MNGELRRAALPLSLCAALAALLLGACNFGKAYDEYCSASLLCDGGRGAEDAGDGGDVLAPADGGDGGASADAGDGGALPDGGDGGSSVCLDLNPCATAAQCCQSGASAPGHVDAVCVLTHCQACTSPPQPSACTLSTECCPGAECDGGTCQVPGGASCSPPGTTCAAPADCCDPAVCVVGGTFDTCQTCSGQPAGNILCSSDADCCGGPQTCDLSLGRCTDGSVTLDDGGAGTLGGKHAGDSCTGNLECVSGACNTGGGSVCLCSEKLTAQCKGPEDCCEGLVCSGNQCIARPTPACASTGDSCASTDCCSGEACALPTPGTCTAFSSFDGPCNVTPDCTPGTGSDALSCVRLTCCVADGVAVSVGKESQCCSRQSDGTGHCAAGGT